MKINFQNIINNYKMLKRKGIIQIVLGSFIRNIIMYLITLIISYILKKEEYGQLSLAENISNILMIINGYGSIEAYLQYASRIGENDKKTLLYENVGKYFKYELILSLIGIIIAIFFINNKAMFFLLIIYAILPPVSFLSELCYSYFRACMRNKEYAYYSVLQVIIVVVFELIFFYFFGLIGIAIGKVFAISLQAFILYKKIKYKLFKLEPIIGKRQINTEYIKYGLYYIFAQLALKIGPYLELQFSNILNNINNVASYRVAAIIPSGLLFIPSSIAVFYYPIIAKYSKNKMWQKRNIMRIIIYTTLMCAIIGISTFLLSEVIINTIYRGKYIESIKLMQLMSLSFIINGGIRVSTSNIILALGYAKFNLKRGLVTMLIQIPLNYYFAYKYSLIGLALSGIIVNFISALMNFIFIKRNIYSRGK